MINLSTCELDGIRSQLHSMFASRSADRVETKNWQGLDVTERPEMTPHELTDVTFSTPILDDERAWCLLVKPNMPWAEQHFKERVSGIPYNPPPSHENWPHTQEGNEQFTVGGKFSHTYPERFWPKHAGDPEVRSGSNEGDPYVPWRGIRFAYGDLMDVVNLMVRDRYTRQAYLPIFFPEDTGAHHGQRIPCTLGYLFRYRNERLDIVYYIRSCDFRRHFGDDVYLAGRLAQWVTSELTGHEIPCRVGNLVMHIGSLHVFEGDLPLIEQEYNREQRSRSSFISQALS